MDRTSLRDERIAKVLDRTVKAVATRRVRLRIETFN
jgi:hypothetical protein